MDLTSKMHCNTIIQDKLKLTLPIRAVFVFRATFQAFKLSLTQARNSRPMTTEFATRTPLPPPSSCETEIDSDSASSLLPSFLPAEEPSLTAAANKRNARRRLAYFHCARGRSSDDEANAIPQFSDQTLTCVSSTASKCIE